MRLMTPIDCPEAPPMPSGDSPEARTIVATLFEIVRKLPDVRPDRVGLLGHSRGAGASLHYVLSGADVQWLVLNSVHSRLHVRATQLSVPVLILHGTDDRPADGGSAV
ncbi:MAG TPA: hypothetical protein VFL57_05440, partial [Bryobacteraceae bacterium]|nr:hypothetical protein [Bryobacteraceae bacterium]